MKKHFLGFLVISALFAHHCSADVLIYSYSGSETLTGPGTERTISLSGQMFFDPATTNNTCVGWTTIGGHKVYWVNVDTASVIFTVPGNGNRTFTILAKALLDYPSTANNGQVMVSFMKGLNASLKISKDKSFTFPKQFSDTEAHTFFESSIGSMVSVTSTQTYVFSQASTQACNNKNQSQADAVNAFIQSLEAKGYRR